MSFAEGLEVTEEIFNGNSEKKYGYFRNGSRTIQL